MRMEYGLFDRAVLQRNRNVCDVAFGGSCKAEGVVMARVKRNGRVVSGFAAKRIGAATGGKFEGVLKGLKAGGPYDVELSIGAAKGKGGEKLTVRSVLVGDVWILAGQSNMEGIGHLKNAAKPHPMVRALYLNDRWNTAKDPINNLSLAIDRVHWFDGKPRSRGKHVGAAPGVAFGQNMHRRTGVPQGLIPCAHGGTSMEQWDPAIRDRGDESFYGAMCRRFNAHGRRVAGVVWYQGEKDAASEASDAYTSRMKTFVAAVRRDMHDPKLPFVLVQIARVIGGNVARHDPWTSVQDQQRRLPEVISNCSVVPAVDLPLDDHIHISAAGQNQLGVRLAYAMSVLKEGRKAGLPPIAVNRITPVQDEISGQINFEVRFANVVGKLRAGGLPTGFAFVDSRGDKSLPFDIRLQGDRAILRTMFTLETAQDKRVHYGLGTDTYCNITDEADRSLPVFATRSTSSERAITPFVREARVSPMLPGAGKLEQLTYPANLESLNLFTRAFQSYFMSRHEEFMQSTDDRVAYFACAFDCPERMSLAVLLGYDGPVRMWLDGRDMYHDPNGTNPAITDSAKVRFDAAPGRHEVLIALGSAAGNAWGIFLRFERLDVTKEQLKNGPEHYKLPRLLG